ncbi:HTH-type transcriptional regulator MalT [Zhongshania aliphaticivorans]|uniref:HTH-type transcriptional regulator MalT n=1 Tax=Zhongshania aliphaticivorans TaxID=1470434 RepID=A0A5S9PIZ4_9GAMM|nr:LuxR C-terminal-related transcriptional regulator [Zhongshania aliphaticivorans]CAA0104191.1 HTH-type transcriptional regulator MalT [Zhongshania aliphaticivorans]CAA0104364.1 HTH-type transcriptional regulator MalT [Zhongshania aliphaticivorans]
MNKNNDLGNGLSTFYRRAGVLESKLRAPFIKTPPLQREALGKLKDEFSCSGGLLTIVAPAGSGKTTLMADLATTELAHSTLVLWINLDDDDNEPSIFAKYLISVLYPLDRAAAEKELSMINANPSRDYDALLSTVVTRLTSSSLPVILFVDDFQTITHPSIIKFWNRVVLHAPSSMKIVISSRSCLPIDLSRKRVAGTLYEVEQTNLNLSVGEIIHYMLHHHTIDLDLEYAEILYDTTEGWLAGLQLAALAITKSNKDTGEVIRSFTGRDKDLADYLLHTVLKGQSEHDRNFLLLTSPLSRMCAPLCNYVMNITSSDETLVLLEQTNHFIVPEDRNRNWYRYHHLFGDFLKNELLKRQPGKFEAICAAAAAWWQSNGNLTEAIQYTLLSNNYVKAAALIAEHAPEVAQCFGDHHTILDWLRRLPEAYHTSRPEVLLNHAWSRAFSRDLTKAQALSKQVLEGLDKPDQYGWSLTNEEISEFRSLAKTVSAIAVTCTDELRDGIKQCDDLLVEINPTQSFITASLYNCQSYAMYALRNHDASIKLAAEAYNFGMQAGSSYALVWADFLAGLSKIEQGKISSARESAERALLNAGLNKKANSYLYAMAEIINSEICIQQCNFNEIENNAKFGKIFSSAFGPLEPLLVSLRNDARREAWCGQLGNAIKILKQGQDTALGTNQPRLYYSLIAEEIEILLRCDDLSAALETCKRTNFLDINESVLPSDALAIVRETVRIADARIKVSQGKYLDALKIINTLLNTIKAKKTTRTYTTQSLTALKAITLWKLNRKKEAARELDKCINTSAPENHAYPIVSAGDTVLEILYDIQSQKNTVRLSNAPSINQVFESRLINILKGEVVKSIEIDSDNKSVDTFAENESLTKREIEILRLVGSGLANTQLAQELIISESTVKWHLHNIYEKIGVKSRTAAAAKAHSLRLM